MQMVVMGNKEFNDDGLRYKLREIGNCSTDGTVVMSLDYEYGGPCLSPSPIKFFFTLLGFRLHVTASTISPPNIIDCVVCQPMGFSFTRYMQTFYTVGYGRYP